MPAPLRLAYSPARPPRPSDLADICEELRVDTLTARRLFRWRAELPESKREALDASVTEGRS